MQKQFCLNIAFAVFSNAETSYLNIVDVFDLVVNLESVFCNLLNCIELV